MLVVVLGTGEFRQTQPNSMIFRSIDVCQYYAKRIPRQYGNFSYHSYIDPKDRVTAYCKPVYVQDGEKTSMTTSKHQQSQVFQLVVKHLLLVASVR